MVGWNQKQLYSFLRAASLNKSMFQRIKAYSLKHLHVKSETLLPNLELDVMPAAWGRSGYELTHQHDAVFHLVFHGILPDVWEIILKALGAYEIKSRFEDVVNPSLRDVHALQVEDILVLPFGGSFSMAGWIGSNKLASPG